ncbi:MAG: TerB family tellurite resistance protein [Hyphomicrobiales bacterium]|nr:TerB family tellurite resistance protein [Hyphomicrobiales bacterium]
MFETLKGFMSEYMGRSDPTREFAPDDMRLASAALLVHVADADGHFGKAERDCAQALVAERFHLDPYEAAQLVREALERNHEEAGIDSFVSILKRSLNPDARLKIVAMLWDIVFADGKVNEVEESMVWRIANMLELSLEELETLRRSRIPDEIDGSENP